MGLLLFLLTLGIYLPAVRYDFVALDDNGYVTQNAHVQAGFTAANIAWAFGTTEVAYWHPLTWLSHMADYAVWGRNAGGHHLTSILLHACNTLLVLLAMRALTGSTWRSTAVAALFGLHPLRVESVAWVAERKDVLSGMCWFLSVWAYARWAGAGTPRKMTSYGLSLLFFALGLLCKPMVVTLPCLLLVLDFWPLRRSGRADSRWAMLVIEKLPFFALAIAASISAIVAQSAIGAMADRAAGLRIANALVSYCRYLEKLFWPADLAVLYPYPARIAAGPVVLATGILAFVSLVALAQRKSRPYLLTGWLWFVGTLVPVIGLVQVGSQSMADRYSYVPTIGIMMMIVWGVADITAGWRRQRVICGVAAGAVCLGLATATSVQLRYWQNSETLFRHSLAVTGDNFEANNALGYSLSESPARLDEAIAVYRESLRMRPDLAVAHSNLGVVLARKSSGLLEGISAYRAALQIDPNFAEAHRNLASALEQVPGATAEAIAEYEAAIRLKPDSADAHYGLANLLARLPHQTPRAVEEYRAALRLSPEAVEMRSNLGNALAQLPGRLPEAIAEYEAVIRVRPDLPGAHYNLANALVQLPGRAVDAITEYEAALRLAPDDYEAEFNLALALARFTDRKADALRHFRNVLRARPDLEPARIMIEQLEPAARVP